METIVKLKAHECKEKKGSLLEDKTLIGYLSMVERLVNMIANKYGQGKQRLSEVVAST